MGKQDDANKKKRQPGGDKLKFFLIGAACMLVVAAAAIAIWFGVSQINKGGAGSAETVFESGGFASPEEAVRAYLKAYKAIDIEEMLSTFAIETFVQNFNFKEQMKNDSYYSNVLSANLAYPNKCSLLMRDNYYQRLFQLEKDIADQVIGYTEPDFGGISGDDLELMEIDELYDTVMDMFPVEEDFAAISSLSLKRFLGSKDIGVSNDAEGTSAQEYYDTAIATYGVDDLQDVVALCDIGGESYCLSFTAFRYGDIWYLGEVGGLTGKTLPNCEQIIKGLYWVY